MSPRWGGCHTRLGVWAMRDNLGPRGQPGAVPQCQATPLTHLPATQVGNTVSRLPGSPPAPVCELQLYKAIYFLSAHPHRFHPGAVGMCSVQMDRTNNRGITWLRRNSFILPWTRLVLSKSRKVVFVPFIGL